MTESPLQLDWTLPPRGPIRTDATEGFVALADALHVDARLLHDRAFPVTQQVNGKPVQSQVVVRFDGPAVRLIDGGGVPFPPGFRPPQEDLRRLLEATARGVNAATAALTVPDPQRAVEVLFRTHPERMALPPVTARSRLGRMLFGTRLDRARNRGLLTGFLTEHAPVAQPPALPGEEDTDLTGAPWLARLRETLAALPRLSRTSLSLAIDPEACQVSARFHAEHPARAPIPGVSARLDPPGLAIVPPVHGNADSLTRAIAACEVSRALHLLLHLYPQREWTLDATYAVTDSEGAPRRLFADRIAADRSMIDLLTR